MSKAEVKCKSLSHVQLFVTSWIVACWAPLSMEFSRQEYWSGSHSHLQGIFPTLESNLGLPHCRQILYCLSHQGTPKVCVAGRQKLGNGGIKLVKKYLRKLGRVSAVPIIMQWQLEKGEQRTSLQTVSMRACMRAMLLQSCSTLFDPMNPDPPGSSVHGILQARILEWVAMPASRGFSWSRGWIHISCIGRWIPYY